MNDSHLPSQQPDDDPVQQDHVNSPRPRRVMRILGILLLVVAGLLTWYLIVFYVGWQSGQSSLEEKRETELAAQIARQVSLARENFEEGSFALALRRTEWVLERAPGNSDAQTLHDMAEARIAAILTPSIPEPTTRPPTPMPNPSPMPTPSLEPIENADSELEHIRQLVSSENWKEAVPALIAYQWQFPDNQRQVTDQLLYEAYIGLGLELVQGEQVELGLAYLEQAEKLGDLPQSVIDYRFWAELYLQGVAFYNVNWGATTYYFRDLCLAAPFYQSSCDRLHESLIAFGDQYAGSLDWCPALTLYEEAANIELTQSLVEKVSQAREACLMATPTPDVPSSETAPITETQPLTNSFSIQPIIITRTPNP